MFWRGLVKYFYRHPLWFVCCEYRAFDCINGVYGNNKSVLDSLTEKAQKCPRLRLNLDLHNSTSDNSQRVEPEKVGRIQKAIKGVTRFNCGGYEGGLLTLNLEIVQQRLILVLSC